MHLWIRQYYLSIIFAEEIKSNTGHTRFIEHNEPGFHPDAYTPLNNKSQLPSDTDFEKLNSLLIRLGSSQLREELEEETNTNKFGL